MKIFVTGATGFIGRHLAVQLAGQGHTIHALCLASELELAPSHPNITCFTGNILDADSVQAAMTGCTQAYHLAGYARKWAKNPRIFFDINVLGTLNVLNAARTLHLSKVVATSTAGVFGPSTAGEITENSARTVPFFYAYESSKFEVEVKIQEYVRAGLDVVIVNPTRVYGPGIMTESNAGTKLMQSYVAGKWHLIPGNGRRIGNYVYVDDVVQGHILAMENGRPGEKYILGGTNASYEEFFGLLRELSCKRFWLHKVPVWAMMGFARLQMVLARLFGRPPAATPYLVRKFSYDFRLSSEKAVRELGYRITPLRVGMQQTLDWIAGEKALEKEVSH